MTDKLPTGRIELSVDRSERLGVADFQGQEKEVEVIKLVTKDSIDVSH